MLINHFLFNNIEIHNYFFLSENNLKLKKALESTASLPEAEMARLRGDRIEAELPHEYIYGFNARYVVCRVCVRVASVRVASVRVCLGSSVWVRSGSCRFTPFMHAMWYVECACMWRVRVCVLGISVWVRRGSCRSTTLTPFMHSVL